MGKSRLLREFCLAVLANLATPGPLLFILEDLHWADETTLAFLAQLARRRRVIKEILNRHAQIKYSHGDIERVAICDKE